MVIGGSKSDTVLNLTRIINAAPERVFDAWLDSAQVSKWIGPGGCEAVELDARVGGKYRFMMHKPNGQTTVAGVYREISRHTRLVFTWTWGEDADTLVTVTFRAVGKGTEITLRHENFGNAEQLDGPNKGWSMSFDQLAELLAK